MKKFFATIGVLSVVGMLIAAVVPPGGGGTLSTLTDVTLTGPADGEALVYDTASGKWINAATAGSGDMTKAVYDANDDGIIDGGAVDSIGSALSSTGADLEAANDLTVLNDLLVGNDTFFTNFVYFLGEIRSDMDMDQGSITNLGELDVSDIWMRGSFQTDLLMGGNDITNVLNAEITGTLDGASTGIITNFAEIHADELTVTTLNATTFEAATHSIGSATVTNNIGAIIAAPVATNVVDMTFASRTVTLNDALTFLHVTNAIASRDMTHVLTLRAGGSDRTLAIPATWQTNTYSAVPANITNGYLTKIYVNTIGATADAASQTNVLVSFEYYKVP